MVAKRIRLQLESYCPNPAGHADFHGPGSNTLSRPVESQDICLICRLTRPYTRDWTQADPVYRVASCSRKRDKKEIRLWDGHFRDW